MKFRVLFAALLCAALAAPAVVAQVGGFPDVPEDHPRADAVRWAAQEELFLGFPDGNLRPDEELTRTQFVKVAERLYDSADAWTRADWAQVMYAGRPSLSGGGAATTSTTGGGGSAVTGAPAGDVSLRCGWPLGDPEPVLPLPDVGPPREIRFPVAPCEPPVTYRIEFQGQVLNLPYAAAGRTFTPAITWRTAYHIDSRPIKVTEFRPGGPVSGRKLGEISVAWAAVRERASAVSVPTIPVATAAPAPTAAATTTTAAPPRTTATVPPRPRVEDVPFEERDVVFHWFIYPGSDEYLDTPLFALYVADPGGPIPPVRRDGTTRSATIWPLLGDRGGGGHSPYGLALYHRNGDRNPKSAFPVHAQEMSPTGLDSFTVSESAAAHPFRSVSYTQVSPPGAECLAAWRKGSGTGIYERTECRPAEWARWWGVYADR